MFHFPGIGMVSHRELEKQIAVIRTLGIIQGMAITVLMANCSIGILFFIKGIPEDLIVSVLAETEVEWDVKPVTISEDGVDEDVLRVRIGPDIEDLQSYGEFEDDHFMDGDSDAWKPDDWEPNA